MEPASVCPKCGYARKESDTAPAWQCPSCGVAIEKYRALQEADRALVQKSIEAASASSAAAVAAAGHPATAALLTQEHWVETPPRLPFERRLAQAFLDLLLAGIFLWCWFAPGAWRPTLAADLGVMVLMEFFVLHSSMFLVAGEGGEGGSGAKLMVGFVVMLFYIPLAGAFAWWHGGWWPALAFVWLLSSRVAGMLAGKGSDAYETMRGRFYWGTAVFFYIAAAGVAVVLSMPKLGFDKGQVPWPKFWSIPPQTVMAWGFFYFAALGLTKLLEDPEWVVAEPETAT